MHILFCACHHYHHLDSSSLSRLITGCRSEGYETTVVSDLCRLGALKSPQLLESCNWIVACHQRAVRSLFPDFAADRILNLRTGDCADIAAALSIQLPASAPPITPGDFQSPPDSWIPWFPVIDRERCVNCRKCLDFCMFGVYSLDAAEQVQVTSPSNCKTDCPACARMCPSQAIIFPKSSEEPINGAEPPASRPSAPPSPGGLLSRLQARQSHLTSPPPLFKDDPT